MFCNKSLVRGTYTLPGLQRTLHKGICRFNASHNLNNDIYLRIIGNDLIIMNQNLLNRISREVSEVQYIFDIDLCAGPFINALMVCVDILNDTAAYCAVSLYCYIYHIFLPYKFLPAVFCFYAASQQPFLFDGPAILLPEASDNEYLQFSQYPPP